MTVYFMKYFKPFNQVNILEFDYFTLRNSIQS